MFDFMDVVMSIRPLDRTAGSMTSDPLVYNSASVSTDGLHVIIMVTRS